MTTPEATPSCEFGGDPAMPDPASAAMRKFQRGGDRADLECALMLCSPALRRAAVRLTGAREADDLLQECFLVAIGRADTFLPGWRLLPWLLGILTNVYRSRHRRRWSLLRKNSAEFTDAEREAHDLASSDRSLLSEIERREWQHQITAAAHSLAEPYRTVVVELLCVGTSVSELAGRLGKPPNTVRSQFHRGLQELRRRLPTPLLAVVMAMLAVREAKAMAATATDGAGTVPRRWRRHPGWWLGLGAAALFAGRFCLSDKPGPSGAIPTVVPVVTTADAASGTVDSPTTIAADRTAGMSATRRLGLQLYLPDGTPASELPVWCDTDFVPGQTVAAVHQSWLRRVSDAEGVVEFEVPRDRVVALRVHEQEILRTLAPGGADVSWVLTTPPSNLIQFECVDGDGHPIAEATIFACGSQGVISPGLPVARSDAVGRGRTRSVRQRTDLWATAPGFRISVSKVVTRTNDASHASVARFVLEPAEQWGHGRVVDQQGAPMPGAVVAVWSAVERLRPPLYFVANADGTFATEHLPRGAWVAAAVAPGHAMAVRSIQAEDQSCELVLGRGVEVTGRVVGGAIRGPGRLRIATRETSGVPYNPISARAALVDSDGSFVLKDMHPGTFLVGVFDKVPNPIATASCVVDGLPPAPLEIGLSAVETWPVRVVDTKGDPVADCLISSVDHESGFTSPDKCLTDADGLALLRRPAAARRLDLYCKGELENEMFPIATVEHAEPGPPGEVLEVAIDPSVPRASLRGQIPHQLLAVRNIGHLSLYRSNNELQLAIASDGSFHAGELVPGSGYHLLWRHEQNGQHCRFQLASFDLAPGATHELGTVALGPMGKLRLRLIGGGPLSSLYVIVHDQANWHLLGVGLRPGSETTFLAPAGRYHVQFPGADGSRCSRSFDIEPGITTNGDLEATGGHPCRLFVSDASLVNGLTVTISIESVAASTTAKSALLLSSWDEDANRCYQDVDLQPGEYQVMARGGSDWSSRSTIMVSARPGLQTFPLSRQ